MPAAISGVVRDGGGDPVPQARVYFTSGPVPLPDIAALTDAEGAFTLSAPVAGRYGIECVAEGFAPARTAVEVSAGREAEVEIRLGP